MTPRTTTRGQSGGTVMLITVAPDGSGIPRDGGIVQAQSERPRRVPQHSVRVLKAAANRPAGTHARKGPKATDRPTRKAGRARA